MHILMVRSVLADNGPGSQSHTIAVELRRRGHRVAFVSSGGAFAPIIEASGFAVHQIPGLAHDQHNPRAIAGAVRGLMRIIRAQQPDVIHGHNAAATACAFIAGLLCGRRIPCVTSVRGVEERETHGWRNGIWKCLPGMLIGVCEKTRQRLIGFGVPPARIAVSYNGVDTARFDPALVSRNDVRRSLGLEGRVVVGLTGAMVGPDFLDGPSKGQKQLVEALARLRESHPDLAVLLVGDGPRRAEVERAAAALGVAERVVFAGQRFDIPEMLSAMDIYCLPSLWGEFFPNSILEAMCMGLPWVGSDIAGLPELTAGGEAGRVVPPGDVAALAAGLAELAGDAALRAARGARARREVLERFTIARVVDRIGDSYHRAGVPRLRLGESAMKGGAARAALQGLPTA
jgi:glycosyltransferase involved in cell wall biosynthesis